nr:uncharacterized protein LOC103413700 [Malus domestica]
MGLLLRRARDQYRILRWYTKRTDRKTLFLSVSVSYPTTDRATRVYLATNERVKANTGSISSIRGNRWRLLAISVLARELRLVLCPPLFPNITNYQCVTPRSIS